MYTYHLKTPYGTGYKRAGILIPEGTRLDISDDRQVGHVRVVDRSGMSVGIELTRLPLHWIERREVCGYSEPWAGPCLNENPCPRHGEAICFQCGEPATRGCDGQSMGLVCGAHECSKHSHRGRHY